MDGDRAGDFDELLFGRGSGPDGARRLLRSAHRCALKSGTGILSPRVRSPLPSAGRIQPAGNSFAIRVDKVDVVPHPLACRMPVIGHHHTRHADALWQRTAFSEGARQHQRFGLLLHGMDVEQQVRVSNNGRNVRARVNSRDCRGPSSTSRTKPC